MKVQAIAPTVLEGEARRRLTGGRLLRRRRGSPLALELLYLPHWLVEYETLAAQDADRQAGPPTSGSNERLAILVCRLSGQAARIDAEHLTRPTRAETLPPILAPAEAEEHAADFAARLLLAAARGKRLRERGAVVRTAPWAYPYWVQYLKRGARIDFRALDAVSAKTAGTAVRSAIATGVEQDATLKRTANPKARPDCP